MRYNYLGIIKILKNDLDRYNKLLLLDLEENYPYYNNKDMEELGAKQDDYIGITSVEFDNGNYLTIDLASGNSNYYDNMVLYDKNDKELYIFDCDYELGNDFEFTYNNELYKIKWVVE